MSLSFLQTSDLRTWADRSGSDRALPRWIERLIKVGAKFAEINFPKDGFTNLPGVDGRLQGCTDRQPGFEQFIPLDDSFWEVSVETTAASKIKRDSSKRSKDTTLSPQNNTLLFATPRSITDATKAKLRSAIAKQAAWKQAIIIDGPLLYDWMCLCPVVALEFACEVHGVARAGLTTLDEAWDLLRHEVAPPLTEALVVASRQKEEHELLRRLGDGQQPCQIVVKGDSEFEALAFILSALRRDTASRAVDRCVVTDTFSRAVEARDLPPSIFVVKSVDHQSTNALSTEKHHYVLLPIGDPIRHADDAIELERPLIWEFAKALATEDSIPEDEADRRARECGGSVTILRRRRPSAVALPPWWAADPHSSLLRSLVLIGRWDSNNPKDLAELAHLVPDPWSQTQTRLRSLVRRGDSPLATAGSVRALRSHKDVFEVLAANLCDDDFKEFANIVRRVFAPAPAIELTSDGDNPFQRRDGYSEILKDGIASALLLLAVRGKEHSLQCPIGIPSHPDGNITWANAPAEAFVQRLLTEITGLGSYRSLLESIRRQYPVLMEAGPDPLLKALEQALGGRPDEIRELLQMKRGFLASWPGATEVFWGLKTLAWSPRYLPRVAGILADIASLEPPTDNRDWHGSQAVGALGDLLIWWAPQTFASVQERTAVLDLVIRKHPGVGWALLKMLQPNGMSSVVNSTRPRMRDVAPRHREIISNRVAYEGAHAVIERLIEQAGTELERWVFVIKSMSGFSPDQREAARDKLLAFRAAVSDPDSRSILWEALRDEIARHRTFAEAQWALKHDELNEWDKILAALKPEDPVVVEKWLFDDWLPEFDTDAIRSVEARQVSVAERRAASIERLIDKGGVPILLRLTESVTYPGLVADAVADVIHEPASLRVLLDEALTKGGHFYGFVAQLSKRAREQILAAGLDPLAFVRDAVTKARAAGVALEAIVMLLMSWPEERATWDFARSLGEDLEQEFWSRAHVPLHVEENDSHYLMEKLIRAGRSEAIIDAAAFGRFPIPAPADVLRLLDGAIVNLQESSRRRRALSHGLPDFLQVIAGREDIDDWELAQRELILLPVLGTVHGIRLRVYQMLARNAEMFVEFLCMVYRKASERGVALEPDEEAKKRGQLAHLVFLSWDQVLKGAGPPRIQNAEGPRPFPGERRNGSIDGLALLNWVTEARKAAAREDRAEVGDLQIGHILAYAPADPDDGAWPHRALRDVIEKEWSEELTRGFIMEQSTKRGVVQRAMYQGGDQEENLAAQAREWADLAGAHWHRTADVLTKIADMWEAEGTRVDTDAKVRRLTDE